MTLFDFFGEKKVFIYFLAKKSKIKLHKHTREMKFFIKRVASFSDVKFFSLKEPFSILNCDRHQRMIKHAARAPPIFTFLKTIFSLSNANGKIWTTTNPKPLGSECNESKNSFLLSTTDLPMYTVNVTRCWHKAAKLFPELA